METSAKIKAYKNKTYSVEVWKRTLSAILGSLKTSIASENGYKVQHLVIRNFCTKGERYWQRIRPIYTLIMLLLGNDVFSVITVFGRHNDERRRVQRSSGVRRRVSVEICGHNTHQLMEASPRSISRKPGEPLIEASMTAICG